MDVISRKLYVLLAFILLGIGSGGVFFFSKGPHNDVVSFKLIKEEGYFIPLQIYGYSKSNIPFLEVDIRDLSIPAIIDLGYQGMFSLPFDLMQKIHEKKWIKRIHSYGIKGGTYENDLYEVEKIKIGDMSFPDVKIKEKSLEGMQESVLEGIPPIEYIYGTIGWELFSEYNLLIDCRHYLLALCDSIETLKQKKYPVEAFTQVSMIPAPAPLTFEAETEKGTLRCLLDTGCTMNMLNKNLEDRRYSHQIFNEFEGEEFLSKFEDEDTFFYNHDQIHEFSSFKIEGKEFGPITFRQINSPIEFDAILGMEFFDSHLVFIDFENKKIHIAPYPKETWPKPDLRPSIGPIRFYNVD